jgi:hypothetical protein
VRRSHENRDLAELVSRETGAPAPEVNEVRVTRPARDLFGVSLSGGGIRSATFNLGVLQALQRLGLLDRLDYLSTVSGGGYVGSFWTAWRTRRAKAGPAEAPVVGDGHVPTGDGHAPTGDGAAARAGGGNGPDPRVPAEEARRRDSAFPQGEGSRGRPEPDPIRHLRDFGNFLAPHLGILKWDTGRMLVSLLSSMVPSLLAALSVIALAMLTWCLAAFGVFGLGASGSTAVFVAMTVAVLVVSELVWVRRDEERDPWSYAEASAWATAAGALLWFFLHRGLWAEGGRLYLEGQRLPVAPGAGALAELGQLLLPVAAWAGVALAFSMRRWLGSRSVTAHDARVARASFDRVHARVMLVAAVWSVAAVMWWAGAVAWGLVEDALAAGAGLGGATALVVLAFSRVQKRLGAGPGRGFGTGIGARLRPLLPRVLAYLAIALMVVATVVAIVAFDRSDSALNAPVAAGLAAAAVLLSAAWRLNPNEIGLHTFYRARIARAYLGASNPDADPPDIPRTEERAGDDLPLNGVAARQPCHLICCAANDLASPELGNLGRGARSAVLSPFGLSVGEESRLWPARAAEADRTPDAAGRAAPLEAPATTGAQPGRREVPTLSEAVTASAAAFNPLMGDKSKEFGPAVTFLMAAFNLRLGLWLPGVRPAPLPRPLGWLEGKLIGLPFLKEMFGMAKARGRHVHLSDGGHFENMALYELVRRHCRFIIAADCGMDPDVGFDDVGNLVRRVRADFGVDIRIDLSPLRPGPDGVSRQPMVAGDIHYPEGDTGILLLIKPTITGNEPADVAQYRTRNAVFPHESTVDQFYDEAQWEAYRRLGEHVGQSAFETLAADLDPIEEDYTSRLFARARREWQPVPEGFEERIPMVADRLATLDDLLREPGAESILRDVVRELDDVGAAPVNWAASQEVEARSLHIFRRALLVMEEIYTRENLEERFAHPLYLGVMNYFARWTSAPLFRMWWPVLRTLHPRPFTRFVERRLGVSTGAGPRERVEGRVGAPESEVDGLARWAWAAENPGSGRFLASGQQVVPFWMTLRLGDRERSIQAAQVLAFPVDSTLAWDSRDFYVPPGFWGAGIGESFLRSLCRAGYDGLYVRIGIDPAGGAPAKRARANEIQLYRSAGFLETPLERVPEAVERAVPGRDEPSGNGSESPDLLRATWMSFRRPGAPPVPLRVVTEPTPQAATGAADAAEPSA